MATVQHASLGGVVFRINPNEIRWDFNVKVHEQRTLGGKVIQVLGTTLGDLTIAGSFGKGGWRAQEKFYDQVKRWATNADKQLRAAPLKFSYPPRNWNFDVFVKGLATPTGDGSVRLSKDEVDPKYVLTLFVVNEGARKVAEKIKDAYIDRLMNGVGWRQSEFNGPESLDNLLQGAGASSVAEFFDKEKSFIYERSLQGTYTPGPITASDLLSVSPGG